MFCTNCGNQITNDSKFCTNCGNPINSSNIGKITFNRKNKFFGCLINIPIIIDGNKVGSISNGGKLEVPLSIGNHKIIFDLWSGANQEEIEITEEYTHVYVDIKIKMGLLTNKTVIENIRREK